MGSLDRWELGMVEWWNGGPCEIIVKVQKKRHKKQKIVRELRKTRTLPLAYSHHSI